MSRASYSRMMRNASPEQRAKIQASNKAHAEFWALPGGGRPETTEGPSIRNAVHNVKSIPGDFAKLGRTIGGGLKHAVQSIGKPAPAGSGGKYGRGRGPRGRGGAMNKALQNKAGGTGGAAGGGVSAQ